MTKVGEHLEWDEAFFEQRKATSQLKHLVLEAYVEKLCWHMDDLYYIDSFAGAAEYRRPDGTTHPGSPVLAARIGERVHAARPSFSLRCINVEENPRRYVRLVAATVPYTPHIVEMNFPGRFTDYIFDILDRIKEVPAFFFIDPFGAKGIAFNDLRPITNRSFTTEVLVTLHTAGIVTKAGYFRRMDEAEGGERDRAAATVQNLAAALDVPLDRLRQWWSSGRAAFTDQIVQRYRQLLRTPNTRFKFTKAFPVYYGPADKRVCFYLVFGTHHHKGLYVMNDCMVKAMDTFKRESYAGTLFAEEFLRHDREQQLIDLEREIVERFPGQDFDLDDVKQAVMQETLILRPQGDYWDVIRKLYREDRLKKVDPGRLSRATRYRIVA